MGLDNKVRVTQLFGGSAAIGFMDPQKDMPVYYGNSPMWITSVASGNYTVQLALGLSGTPVATAYPHDLIIDAPSASGFGWPSTGGSQKVAHGDTWPNGVPDADHDKMVFMEGDETPLVFTR